MPCPPGKWPLGCGIGCAAAVALVLLLGFWGILFVRHTVSEFDEAIAARQRLEQRFGPPASYVPPPDGRIAPDRLEAFLTVRRDTAPTREAMIRSIGALEERNREREGRSWLRRLRDGLHLTRTGLGLGIELADFYTARNEALLREGMGLGEYSYLYGLVYYAWLGMWRGEESPGGAEEREKARAPAILSDQRRRLAHRLQILLDNQWAALTAREGPGGAADTMAGAAAAAWRRELAAEVAACKADPERIPWQDSLPPRITELLAPFRERLEAIYSPLSDPFELTRNRRRGWSIGAD